MRLATRVYKLRSGECLACVHAKKEDIPNSLFNALHEEFNMCVPR